MFHAFSDGAGAPELLLDMLKVKTWFHNIGGLKEDSPWAKLKDEMTATNFDANATAGELLHAYHNRPRTFIVRTSAAEYTGALCV